VFWSLIGGEERRKLYGPVTKDEFDATERAVEQAIGGLDRSAMDRKDAELIKDEVRNGAAMLVHGCRRGRWRLGAESMSVDELVADMQGIVAEHERLWLARNRPGGLPDSIERLTKSIDGYRARRIH
jgi:hypothetical protein